MYLHLAQTTLLERNQTLPALLFHSFHHLPQTVTHHPLCRLPFVYPQSKHNAYLRHMATPRQLGPGASRRPPRSPSKRSPNQRRQHHPSTRTQINRAIPPKPQSRVPQTDRSQTAGQLLNKPPLYLTSSTSSHTHCSQDWGISFEPFTSIPAPPNSDEEPTVKLHRTMRNVGDELERSTDAFKLNPALADKNPPAILDLCMAPGSFLELALRENPNADVVAFTLPTSEGGYRSTISGLPKVKQEFLDITMLAADMGMDEIPSDHEDADNFLQGQLDDEQLFDLVICDGQVSDQHPRAAYRANREERRLLTTQLALGLEHVKCGGSMVVRLHRLEAWSTVNILWAFCEFASIRLFKAKSGDVRRSYFYLVAQDIDSDHTVALEAIEEWKWAWQVATFGSDEEYEEMVREEGPDVETLLEEFGPMLVALGGKIWTTQAEALVEGPFAGRI
jgi:23S rRNA U2552 (ribose-2'-O)-methylase RlmE/FtsJ